MEVANSTGSVLAKYYDYLFVELAGVFFVIAIVKDIFKLDGIYCVWNLHPIYKKNNYWKFLKLI